MKRHASSLQKFHPVDVCWCVPWEKQELNWPLMRGNRSGKSRKQPKWDAWQPKWEEERSVVSANSTATTYHCTAQTAPNQTPHYTALNPKHRVNPQSIALHKIQIYQKNGLPSTHQMIDDFHTFVVRIYADFLD